MNTSQELEEYCNFIEETLLGSDDEAEIVNKITAAKSVYSSTNPDVLKRAYLDLAAEVAKYNEELQIDAKDYSPLFG